jgi:hypothetical protein
MPVDCQTPANGEEKLLCSCLESTKALQRMLDTYEDAMRKYRSDEESYAKYKADWQDWNANTGDFEYFAQRTKDLLAEKKETDNCMTWAAANAGNHNDYCVNDFGQGWIHTGKADSNCISGWGVAVCQRSADTVKNIVNGEKAALEPNIVPEPRQPDAPSNVQIQCCANIINTGVGDLRNVSQRCQQAINEKLGVKDGAPSSSIGIGILWDVTIFGIRGVIWCVVLCVCLMLVGVGVYVVL